MALLQMKVLSRAPCRTLLRRAAPALCRQSRSHTGAVDEAPSAVLPRDDVQHLTESVSGVQREADLRMRLKWRSLAGMADEVESLGQAGARDAAALLAGELRLTLTELRALVESTGNPRDDEVRRALDEAVSKRVGDFEVVMGKMDEVEQQMHTLRQRVSSLQESEEALLRRVFHVVSLAHFDRLNKQHWVTASHADVFPFLQHLLPLRSEPKFETIQLSDCLLSAVTGHKIVFEGNENVCFPQATIVMPSRHLFPHEA